MTAPPSATSVFSYLAANREPVLERFEFATTAFSALRRNVRNLILSLAEYEGADALDLCRDLRSMLSEWLTMPVPFDGATFEHLNSFGGLANWEERWGVAVRGYVEEALAAAERAVLEPSPLRHELGQALNSARRDDLRIVIACHRRATRDFISLMVHEAGGDERGTVRFIHTATDYRGSQPFDLLIKVGPLRSRGWGAVPDAILSAPRYHCLKQFVWAGCLDEPGFGADPVLVGSAPDLPQDSVPGTGIHWSRVRREVVVGEYRDGYSPDQDDLSIVSSVRRDQASRPATLLLVGVDEGILYPPHSTVVSYDPDARDGHIVAQRIPGESLVEGVYVVLPRLGAVDLGDTHAPEGHLSGQWKAELRRRYQDNARDLAIELRAAGVRLRSIDHCIKHWCKSTTTVITAPQKMAHFKALMEVLQVKFPELPRGIRGSARDGWERAWLEVRHSRGDAIQQGLQAQDIINSSLIELLNRQFASQVAVHAREDFFELRLPDNIGLDGVLRFFRVRSIEHGFIVPEDQLRLIVDLDTVEQWRA